MKLSLFFVILALALAVCNCQSTNDLLDGASAEDAQWLMGKKDFRVAVHSLTFPERKQLRSLKLAVSKKSAENNELRKSIKVVKKQLSFRTRLLKDSVYDLQKYERCVRETNWIDTRCREISFYETNKETCEQSVCGDGDKLVRTLKEREDLTERATKDLNAKVEAFKSGARDILMAKRRGKQLLERTHSRPSNRPRYSR